MNCLWLFVEVQVLICVSQCIRMCSIQNDCLSRICLNPCGCEHIVVMFLWETVHFMNMNKAHMSLAGSHSLHLYNNCSNFQTTIQWVVYSLECFFGYWNRNIVWSKAYCCATSSKHVVVCILVSGWRDCIAGCCADKASWNSAPTY